ALPHHANTPSRSGTANPPSTETCPPTPPAARCNPPPLSPAAAPADAQTSVELPSNPGATRRPPPSCSLPACFSAYDAGVTGFTNNADAISRGELKPPTASRRSTSITSATVVNADAPCDHPATSRHSVGYSPA